MIILFYILLACIGEGNGNPLECSCLENPRDGGAWWAAVYGVTQSRTRLKQLSSSSSVYLRKKYRPWNSLGQNTGVSSLSLLQGIFSTQGSNPGLLHCRRILPAEPPAKPKNTGVGSLFLPQGIFLIQELNQGLLHCRWIHYQLSYQGSPIFMFLFPL